MAYAKSIRRKCQRTGCERPSTKEVFGADGTLLGRYCGPHARETVNYVSRQEAERGTPEDASAVLVRLAKARLAKIRAAKGESNA